jgi:hypothetical protein
MHDKYLPSENIRNTLTKSAFYTFFHLKRRYFRPFGSEICGDLPEKRLPYLYHFKW